MKFPIFLSATLASAGALLIGSAPLRAAPLPARGSAALIGHLRCQSLANPLAVDAAQPRLSWTIAAGGRGWTQSAYRIEVASSARRLAAGAADLWRSGEVVSNRTLGVRYAGKALESGAPAFWRVRVRDQSGRQSPWSASGFWSAGLRPEDWRAQWISAPTSPDTQTAGTAREAGLVLPPAPCFRKGFVLNQPIRRATLFASARGVYEMRLNGARVGDERLAPGWTDYYKRVQYEAYDVTRQLKRGQNVLGAWLGDGWYSGYVGFARRRDNYGKTPAVRAQLQVELADGTRQIIGSDASWRAATGPILYSDMLMGEFYDARRETKGWDRAGFDDRGWKPARRAPEVEAPAQFDVTAQVRSALKNGALSVRAGNELAGDPAYLTVKRLQVDYTLDGVPATRSVAENEVLQLPGAGESGVLSITRAIYGVLQAPRAPALLVASRGPAVRVTQELAPVKITRFVPGTFIFDMGQNMVGVARLRVRGAAGTAIKLRFAEMLSSDGSLYTANLRSARATDTYVCRGEGLETWEPRFTFHGFRYIEVTGFPGTPTREALSGLVIGSDTPKTGTFSCSSALVNQLQSNIDWGQRGNFLSVPTDCPQRDERLGWLGDAQVFARTATYNRDVNSFFEKWLQDVEDAQAPDGGFPDVAPRKVDEANGAPAWGDAGIIVPWTVYQAYGDTDVITRHWAAMERWMAYIGDANPSGLWLQRRGNDFGDWLSIGADTPKDVLATAYYAYDASLMAQMARATGRASDAAKYDALFERIKAAFNLAYVSNEGRVKGETQTAYLLALRFDLLPASLRARAAGHLVADIAAKNGHLSTGFVGVGYLCPVLSATGHNEVAYRLLQNDTFPSWGFSIRQGATTIWERWDGWTPDKGFQNVGMNSFNHYSLGSVGEWLFGDVAGIRTDPRFPGYERIVIAPRPGPGLSFARASYDSVRGPITSAWKIEANRFTLDLSIPANTRATVRVPNAGAQPVMEGDALAQSAPGVRFIGREGNESVFEIGSGTYRFSTRAR